MTVPTQGYTALEALQQKDYSNPLYVDSTTHQHCIPLFKSVAAVLRLRNPK